MPASPEARTSLRGTATTAPHGVPGWPDALPAFASGMTVAGLSHTQPLLPATSSSPVSDLAGRRVVFPGSAALMVALAGSADTASH
ncbi:hypothetical protein [Streptomyces olivaceiscleroticus]|uniref:Uncharacterized protein n=1 Tax=Streptomyces olivaceiscleroticus TaxID=68245 RepID=A0ABN0ZVZ1_9ACTN